MKGPLWLLGVVVAAAGLGVAGALIPGLLQTTVLGLLLFFLVVWIGRRISKPVDEVWLTRLVAVGFAAKLVASGLRYVMVAGLYESGDSLRYHRVASTLVDQWRAFEVPRSTTAGGVGTHLVEQFTALLYVPYVPSLLGGFFIFGTLSFLGQTTLYVAFRRALPPQGLKTYAKLVFFLPSLAFWPASIGKEAVMLLLIGIFAVGAAGLLTNYRFRSSLPAALGIAGASFIRPHVGAIMLGTLGVAALLAKRPPRPAAKAKRWLLLAAVALVMVSLTTFVGERFGITPTQESLEQFAAEVADNTGQGGSEVAGSPISSPLDFPAAMVRVLFRPLPHEARNVQTVLSSIESVGLLILTVWRLPYLWRNLRSMRRFPYLLAAVLFVVAFVVAFSPVLNLGILARQRTQALPFFLVLLVGLGWQPRQQAEVMGEETEDLLVR